MGKARSTVLNLITLDIVGTGYREHYLGSCDNFCSQARRRQTGGNRFHRHIVNKVASIRSSGEVLECYISAITGIVGQVHFLEFPSCRSSVFNRIHGIERV